MIQLKNPYSKKIINSYTYIDDNEVQKAIDRGHSAFIDYKKKTFLKEKRRF